MSVRPFFRMEQLSSHWTDIHEILHFKMFKNLSKMFKFCSNPAIMTGTLHEGKGKGKVFPLQT
jgi:hypothetical protein